jgi:hypothetical protein
VKVAGTLVALAAAGYGLLALTGRLPLLAGH